MDISDRKPYPEVALALVSALGIVWAARLIVQSRTEDFGFLTFYLGGAFLLFLVPALISALLGVRTRRSGYLAVSLALLILCALGAPALLMLFAFGAVL